MAGRPNPYVTYIHTYTIQTTEAAPASASCDTDRDTGTGVTLIRARYATYVTPFCRIGTGTFARKSLIYLRKKEYYY
jgi:hypothetical protein